MKLEYYYNNVPGHGKCRNNLIYTSLISQDKKTFVQWYHNDTEYHYGMNEVVDPEKMEEKWEREVQFLKIMDKNFPMHIPKILDINYSERKIFLEIEGDDFWEQSGCITENYNNVLPNWEEQMLEIIRAHKSLGIYKYSMHPSSYFLVDGKLKSINYFFCYMDNEKDLLLDDVLSHISENRRKDLFPKMHNMGIDTNKPISHYLFQQVAFESFKTNFNNNFMEIAKSIYA